MNTKVYKPAILNFRQAAILKIKKSAAVIDYFESQIRELFLIRNPSFRFKPLPEIKSKQDGVWVYYPWRNCIVHILNKSEFQELRTARNRNLITLKEQTQISTYRLGISGLSVGNSVGLVLALEGFNNFRLTDYDELSVSNLNRLRGSLIDLGLNKAIITARQIYEINPFANVDVMDQGIRSDKDLNHFFKNLNLVVDETDDVEMRLKIRILARKKKIPVVSAADNGVNAVVDVERFDLKSKMPIYHGHLKKFDLENVSNFSFAEKFQLINAMVGVELVSPRMKESLLEVGKSLYSWPQLAGAAQLSGSAVAYIVKAIARGGRIKSGKYDVNLERIFTNDYDSRENKSKRLKQTLRFLKLQTKFS